MNYFNFTEIKTQVAQAAADAKSSVTKVIGSEKGQKVTDNVWQLLKTGMTNRHVLNTLGGGFVGVLIASTTFLPLQFCFTIGVILGAYKSLTSN